MAISNKLTTLNGIKQDIKQAIVDKGVDMTDVAFNGYAGKIGEISAGGASGGYDVYVENNGGGNEMDMEVKFSDDKYLRVAFPSYHGSYADMDISLKNVVWLHVRSFGVGWDSSEGITQAQATNSAGYNLTENVAIYLRD